MKKIISKYKVVIIVCVWVLTSICFLFGGAMIGLEYYQDEFAEFRTTAISIIKGTETVSEVVLDANDTMTLTVNDFELEINLSTATHTWFDVGQMSTLITNTISLDEMTNGYDVYIDGIKMEVGAEIEVELEELNKATSIEIVLVNQETDENTYYNIRTLHSTYDSYASGEGEGDGYYYFNKNDTIYKMDMSGNIVYYKEVTSGRDFKQVTIDDTVYYTYVEAAVNNTDEKLIEIGYTQVQGVVMDENYEVIDRVEFLNTSEGMPETHSLENHEFIMLDVGHYFVSAYVGMEVDNIPTDVEADGEAYVIASVIQEIKDGELLFQWVSTDYEELYALSGDRIDYSSDDEALDYMHFNSIDFDEDGNLICSFRRIDSVIKIDRDTAEIIWILGGDADEFGLTEDEKFSYQHMAYYSDENTITLFDNGYEAEQTRAVEITIDEETMSVIDYNAYEIEGTYSVAMGSAIRLDDEEAIFLMGWGTKSADNVVFSELNFDTGEIYFQLVAGDGASSYRVFKFDS